MKANLRSFAPSVPICIVLLFLSCHQEIEEIAKDDQVSEIFLNPYLTTSVSPSGRINPYLGDNGAGIGEHLGPVVAPAAGFFVNDHYNFAPGEEFYVDVALSNNNKIGFFISGTHTILSKSNGDEQRPDEITDAFAFDGMVYAWGTKNGEEFTWTIGFVKNHIEIRPGYVGRPLKLTTNITAALPESPITNSSAMTLAFESNDPRASFECSLNGANPAPCSSPVTYQNLVDGPYTFYVRAVLGDRQDEEGATYTWTVDQVSPFITFIRASTTKTTIQIDWTTSEPSTAQIEWGMNPVPENVIAETSDYQTTRTLLLTDLPAGTVYYFHISGKDQAGNTFRSSRFTAATRRN